jgi:hypothetical protein
MQAGLFFSGGPSYPRKIALQMIRPIPCGIAKLVALSATSTSLKARDEPRFIGDLRTHIMQDPKLRSSPRAALPS